MIAPFIYEGTMTSQLFNEWVEKILIPDLEPNQIVLMDNASFHRSVQTRKLLEEAGHQVIFIPKYSPELNPIEHIWAVLKHYVRRFISQFNSLYHTLQFIFEYIPLFSGK